VWRASHPGYKEQWLKRDTPASQRQRQRRKERDRERRVAEKAPKVDSRRHPDVPSLYLCLDCKKYHPRGSFRKAGVRADGTVTLRSYCRTCTKPRDAAHHKRRTIGKGQFSKADVLKLFVDQRGICACGCGESLYKGYHVDHIVALSRGGTNWPDNLQLLTPLCNLKKGAR
jgi:5-methylcytosine-specific restriction endonuclease McrA